MIVCGAMRLRVLAKRRHDPVDDGVQRWRDVLRVVDGFERCLDRAAVAVAEPKRATANSTLPICEGAAMLPATRMTNRSPSPWSKTNSAGARESEQPRITANGRCARA